MCAISRLAVISAVLFSLSSFVVWASKPTKVGSVPAQLSSNHVSIGATNSFRGIGICADICTATSDFHSVSVTADLTNIVNGKVSTPGMRITYHYDMKLAGGTTPAGYGYMIYAGPGIAQGYLRSLDSRKGYMAGLSGAAGGKVYLGRSISISAECQADAALIFKNKYIHHMSLYKEGIIHSFIPYIRIQYCF